MMDNKNIVTAEGPDGWIASNPVDAPTLLGFGATAAMAVAGLQVADIARTKALRAAGMSTVGAVVIWADVSRALEADGWSFSDYKVLPDSTTLRTFTKAGNELAIAWNPKARVSSTAIDEVCARTGLVASTVVPTGAP